MTISQYIECDIDGIKIVHRKSYTGNIALTQLVTSISNELILSNMNIPMEYPNVRPWEDIIIASDTDSNQPVGFIQFFVNDGVVSISLSGVDADYRNDGVYTDMYLFLRNFAIDEGYSTIVSHTLVQNEPMISLALAQNRKVEVIAKISDDLFEV